MFKKYESGCRLISSGADLSRLALSVLLLAGCATSKPVPKTEYQASLGKVSIITSSQVPEIKLQGPSDGASNGAKTALKGCANLLPSGGSAGGEYGGAVALIGVILTAVCSVVATPVAAVIGAATAPNAAERQSIQDSLAGSLTAKTIQETMRDKVIVAASAEGTTLLAVQSTDLDETSQPPNYRPFAAKGIDTVLEVSMSKIGLEGTGVVDPPLLVTMMAQARLVRTRDNAEIDSWNGIYKGKRLKFSEWSSDDAVQLSQELNRGYEQFASDIFDRFFMLYPFPDRIFTNGPNFFGLDPVEPIEHHFHFNAEKWRFADVDGLQPVFRWSGFPRQSDSVIAPDKMARVKNVRFDFAIFKLREGLGQPGRVLVYRRNGLPSNQHQLETPLEYDSQYVWTVRARFDRDGRQRVTEWSDSPKYRFATPEKASSTAK